MNKFKITVEEQVTYTHEIEVETVLSELAVDKFLDEIENDLTTKDDVEVICSELEDRGIEIQGSTIDKHERRSAIWITDMEEIE